MKRRSFMATVGVGAAAAAVGTGAPGIGAARALAAWDKSDIKMHVGSQKGIGGRRRRGGGPAPSPEEVAEQQKRTLLYFQRYGMKNACGYPPRPGEKGHWSVEDLEKLRDLYAKYDISLDMVALPFLTNSHIDRERQGAIMLGKSPERDRDIENINIMTANCAKAGIPSWKYNMSLLGNLRIRDTQAYGRGGVRVSHWDASKAKADPPLTRAGKVSVEMFWERITYFLERVIPVCEEYKVRAACHPHDPGSPPGGWQGIEERVLGSFEGLKKFVSINDSPYHGLNLCLGVTGENLDNPREELNEVIRFFGERKKIFNIHFRNIKGRRGKFEEAFIDDGDMDMLGAMITLAEVGYPYMVMPDHSPRHPDDPAAGDQSHAHDIAFIKAYIEAAKRMV